MEPGVFTAAENFKRDLFLNLYREGGENLTFVCLLLPPKREIKNCLTLAVYFLRLETPGLPSFLPALSLSWFS